MSMHACCTRVLRGPLLALAILAGMAVAALPAAAADTPETIAVRLLDRLDAGDYAGAEAMFWRSLDAVDPVADARALDLPMLLLHGGRDFQVVEADRLRWREAFDRDRRATLKHYPALNHLGITGEGPGTPAEYQQAGKMDATLVADIARWIHATAPDRKRNRP